MQLKQIDAKVSVTLDLDDLKEFAKCIVDETLEAVRVEQEEMAKKVQEAPKESPKVDVYVIQKEAARQLGVTVPTLWRWEKIGFFKPASRVGRHTQYLQSQIDELLSSGKNFPKGQAV